MRSSEEEGPQLRKARALTPHPLPAPRTGASTGLLVCAAAIAAIAVASSLGGGGAAGELVIDGLAFPQSLRTAGATQQLMGGGTRYKYGAVKVRPRPGRRA